MMLDPTYVTEEIEANPTWKLAWAISELENDNAPIGWSDYIRLAEYLLHRFFIEERNYG